MLLSRKYTSTHYIPSAAEFLFFYFVSDFLLWLNFFMCSHRSGKKRAITSKRNEWLQLSSIRRSSISKIRYCELIQQCLVWHSHSHHVAHFLRTLFLAIFVFCMIPPSPLGLSPLPFASCFPHPHSCHCSSAHRFHISRPFQWTHACANSLSFDAQQLVRLFMYCEFCPAHSSYQ